jgi:hypothetical protein
MFHFLASARRQLRLTPSTRSVALRGNWWGTEILEQQSAAGKTSAWRRQNKEGNKCADQPLTLKTVHQIGLRHFIEKRSIESMQVPNMK